MNILDKVNTALLGQPGVSNIMLDGDDVRVLLNASANNADKTAIRDRLTDSFDKKHVKAFDDSFVVSV